MKRYYRKNRPSVALFLVSNLLAAGSSVFMSFLLGAFADSAMEGDFSRVWKIALVTLFYLCIETFSLSCWIIRAISLCSVSAVTSAPTLCGK